MNWRLLPVLAALIALPATARAAAVPWVSGAIGASTYAMDDVNRELDDLNALLAVDGVPLRMDLIDNGADYGAAFGVALDNGFGVGVGYDRLTGRSRISDYTGSIEYDLPANLIRVLGRFEFAPKARSTGFVEAAVGRVSLGGSISLTVTDAGSVVGDLSGSGMAFEFGAGGRVGLAPQLGLIAGAGFRHASVSDVEINGNTVAGANGGDYSVDYSGLFVKLGLQLELSTR